MDYLKKALGLVLVLTSGFIWAGTMGPICAPNSDALLCKNRGWMVNLEGLYLKPNFGNGYDNSLGYTLKSYVDSAATRLPTTLKPSWGGGFRIEGAYLFNKTNDFDVNWFEFSRQTNSPYSYVVPGSIAVRVAQRAVLGIKLDAINFELGQRFNFGENMNLRLYGGIQLAHTDTSLSIDELTVANSKKILSGTYTAYGPRVGADLAYNLQQGFGVFAKGAAGLLAGKNDTGGELSADQYQMVPELEAKLGVSYAFVMPSSNFSVSLGYMWMEYIGLGEYFTDPTYGGSSSFDLSLQGPYLGFKWVG